MDAKQFIIDRHGDPKTEKHIHEVEAYAEMMEDFAQMKCEEQRILCEEYATVHDFMPNDPIEDKIRNAPLATDK